MNLAKKKKKNFSQQKQTTMLAKNTTTKLAKATTIKLAPPKKWSWYKKNDEVSQNKNDHEVSK